jgi:hypothetical protein
MAGIPIRKGGKLYRRDGRPLTVVRRHWRDYPAPTPQPTPCRIWQGALYTAGYRKPKATVSAAALFSDDEA